MKDTVLVFARVPRLGAVKRRLASGVGAGAALRFYRATLFRVLRRLLAETRFRTILCITPARARLVLPGRLARRLPLRLQGPGDLGARMARALRAFPAGRVAIVGADIPELLACDVRAAFAALGGAEAVFGPAEDGGYWLIAFGPRRPARAFAQVRWSGPHALADTLANFRGRRVRLLRRLRDVDTLDDYRAALAARSPAR